jgi:hypothetical protein
MGALTSGWTPLSVLKAALAFSMLVCLVAPAVVTAGKVNPYEEAPEKPKLPEVEESLAGFGLLMLVMVLVIVFVVGYLLKNAHFHYLHESGAAMLIGLVTGILIRYGTNAETLRGVVAFDQHFFFLVLLPPIIFESGYNMKRVRNYTQFKLLSNNVVSNSPPEAQADRCFFRSRLLDSGGLSLRHLQILRAQPIHIHAKYHFLSNCFRHSILLTHNSSKIPPDTFCDLVFRLLPRCPFFSAHSTHHFHLHVVNTIRFPSKIKISKCFPSKLFFLSLVLTFFAFQGHFFYNFDSILWFALLGTMISMILTGLLVYLFSGVIGMTAVKLELIDCMFIGAILSATDPVTVLSLFKELGVTPNLYANVFGESVLNDAVAIVLYKYAPSQAMPHAYHYLIFQSLFSRCSGSSRISFTILSLSAPCCCPS